MLRTTMAKEPTLNELKKQLRKVLAKYNDRDPRAGMLSGMALVAQYLEKLDGSKTMTPSVVYRAVCDVAAERGLQIVPLGSLK